MLGCCDCLGDLIAKIDVFDLVIDVLNTYHGLMYHFLFRTFPGFELLHVNINSKSSC